MTQRKETEELDRDSLPEDMRQPLSVPTGSRDEADIRREQPPGRFPHLRAVTEPGPGRHNCAERRL